jgi:hypothetical protein
MASRMFTRIDNLPLHQSHSGQVQSSCERQPAIRYPKATQNVGHGLKKRDFVGNLLSDQCAFHLPEYLEVRQRDIGRVSWLCDPFQQIVLKKVLGHPRIAVGCIVNVNDPFFYLGSGSPGKNRSSKGTKFWSMSHDALKEPPGGNIVKI